MPRKSQTRHPRSHGRFPYVPVLWMETELLTSETIYKLLAFTLAMVVVPIGSYFLTVHTVFKG
jgi:hypothetical protein